jgi:RecG-like helicase
MIGILPGRSAADTKVFRPGDISKARSIMAQLVKEGQQAFVVCPRIKSNNDNPSNHSPANGNLSNQNSGQLKLDHSGGKHSVRPEVVTVAQQIQTILPGIGVGLLHGRLNPKERDEVMDDFRSGKLRVLVATTMVEVGVDVPTANVMLVEGAEYFGLAQLHQLRGRVGRGGGQGHFLLVPGRTLSETTAARLNAIVSHNDGYALAEMDLKLRGPGEELGLRQSGWPILDFAKLPQDLHLLSRSFELAQDLWNNRDKWGPDLQQTLCLARDELAMELPDDPPGF